MKGDKVVETTEIIPNFILFFFTEEEYALLDEIRTRRNYWCHQCYLEWVYIGDDYKRQNRLDRMTRQLENEHNRAEKLQRKMERIYIEEFAED